MGSHCVCCVLAGLPRLTETQYQSVLVQQPRSHSVTQMVVAVLTPVLPPDTHHALSEHSECDVCLAYDITRGLHVFD